MSPMSLRFQNVSFSYPTMTRPLLVGVEAHFPCGWTGVVGANGVGKSTLLRLATGELAAQGGTVHHLGSALYCAQRTDDAPGAFAEFAEAVDREAVILRQQLGVESARSRKSTNWASGWRPTPARRGSLGNSLGAPAGAPAVADSECPLAHRVGKTTLPV